jgi:hypothetical protein
MRHAWCCFDLGGHSVLQGESKEALAETMKSHPHFMMPDGFIEIVEIMAIPGMQSNRTLRRPVRRSRAAACQAGDA